MVRVRKSPRRAAHGEYDPDKRLVHGEAAECNRLRQLLRLKSHGAAVVAAADGMVYVCVSAGRGAESAGRGRGLKAPSSSFDT